MKMKKIMILATVSVLMSACGTSPGERGVSGGLLGAGAGAAVGAAFGNAGAGALIGGAAGAATGALSDPCSLNLGSPFWKDKGASRDDFYRRCGHYPR
jgi:osmotically inducible lipoprotein OsmB